MDRRAHCGACCIAPSSPIPGTPHVGELERLTR